MFMSLRHAIYTTRYFYFVKIIFVNVEMFYFCVINIFLKIAQHIPKFFDLFSSNSVDFFEANVVAFYYSFLVIYFSGFKNISQPILPHIFTFVETMYVIVEILYFYRI